MLSFKILNIFNNCKLIQYINISKKNDNINYILEKVVNELNLLFTDGFEYKNQYYNTYMISVCCDMPATIKLLNLHNFVSSNRFCRSCNALSHKKVVEIKHKKKNVRFRYSIRGIIRKYKSKYITEYGYTEIKEWKKFSKNSYLVFLKNFNKKRKKENTINKLFSLEYFNLNLITFDCMHTVCNSIFPLYNVIISKLIYKYNIKNIKVVYSQSSSIYDYDLLNIKQYNILQTNFIFLNILPFLLLNEEEKYSCIFNIINIINKCIYYNYTTSNINSMYKDLISNMLKIEIYYGINITPSLHSIVHIIDYMKSIGHLKMVKEHMLIKQEGFISKLSRYKGVELFQHSRF